MKRSVAALMAWLPAAPVLAQAPPGSLTETLTLASIKQPLLPVWYAITYGSLVAVAIFFVTVIVKFFRSHRAAKNHSGNAG